MSKGGNFEIKVARMFTKWVTGKEKPEILWRSVSLGPKATMDRRKGGAIRKIGDLVSIDPKGQWIEDTFFIECKHHKEANLLDLFKEKPINNKSNVLNWWTKCNREAEEAERIPFLVFKGNHQLILTMMPENLLAYKLKLPTFMICLTKHNNRPVVIFPFIRFLEVYKAEEVRKILN